MYELDQPSTTPSRHPKRDTPTSWLEFLIVLIIHNWFRNQFIRPHAPLSPPKEWCRLETWWRSIKRTRMSRPRSNIISSQSPRFPSVSSCGATHCNEMELWVVYVQWSSIMIIQGERDNINSYKFTHSSHIRLNRDTDSWAALIMKFPLWPLSHKKLKGSRS